MAKQAAMMRSNKRARGGGGMTILFHAGCQPPAAPQHDRWGLSMRLVAEKQTVTKLGVLRSRPPSYLRCP